MGCSDFATHWRGVADLQSSKGMSIFLQILDDHQGCEGVLLITLLPSKVNPWTCLLWTPLVHKDQPVI